MPSELKNYQHLQFRTQRLGYAYTLVSGVDWNMWKAPTLIFTALGALETDRLLQKVTMDTASLHRKAPPSTEMLDEECIYQ